MSALPKGKLLDLPLTAYELAMRVNATSILVCSKAAVRRCAPGAAAGSSTWRRRRLSRLAAVLTVSASTRSWPLPPPSPRTSAGTTSPCNAIAPGMIQTEEGFRAAGAVGSDRRTARGKGVPNVQPDRQPEALVGTLLLLASDAGDYINGQTLIVDGGRNCRL